MPEKKEQTWQEILKGISGKYKRGTMAYSDALNKAKIAWNKARGKTTPAKAPTKTPTKPTPPVKPVDKPSDNQGKPIKVDKEELKKAVAKKKPRPIVSTEDKIRRKHAMTEIGNMKDISPKLKGEMATWPLDKIEAWIKKEKEKNKK